MELSPELDWPTSLVISLDVASLVASDVLPLPEVDCDEVLWSDESSAAPTITLSGSDLPILSKTSTATAYRLDRFRTGRMIDEKGMGAQPNLH